MSGAVPSVFAGHRINKDTVPNEDGAPANLYPNALACFLMFSNSKEVSKKLSLT